MGTAIAIFLIILKIVIHKFEGIFIKKYDAKHSKGGFIFTAIVSFFSMLFFLFSDIIMDPKGLQFEKNLIYFGLISGVCFAVASLTMYWVLGNGPYGLCSLISSYGILVTIGYGLIIGEKVSFLAWIGVALICVALFLIMARKSENTKLKVNLKWMIVLVFSVCCSSAIGIMMDFQQDVFSKAYDNEFMIITLLVSSIFLFIAGVIKDGKHLKEIFKYGFFYAAAGGVSNGVTNFLTLIVYALVPVSFAAPMGTGCNILIAFIIARVIFKEKYTVRQYLGVALSCIALILFNI